jgi:hypothetical protein
LGGSEHIAHLEIAYPHELSWSAACGPDISVDILSESNHHSERLVVWFRQATEPPILEEIQAVVYAHPHVAGAVFEHGGDLVPRQTIAPADGGDRPVPEAIERPVVYESRLTSLPGTAGSRRGPILLVSLAAGGN